MKELIARLALQFHPNLGGITVKKLLQHYGSATEIFSEKSAFSPLGKRVPVPRLTQPIRELAEQELAYMERHHIHLCFYTDENIPKRLKMCVDAPYMFYYRGSFVFDRPKMVAVVGTRNVSPYGKDATHRIISELAPYDVCVVSGLARGVDTVAHDQALDSGLKTVAVLGCGFRRIYPDSNERLAQRIIEQGGGILSEFPFLTKPDRQNFPQRNRIIAGLSDVTLVMETAEKGGSIITAHIAHSYNRDVMAVPGNIFSPTSSGCHALIKKNIAALATGGQDVIELMRWDDHPVRAVQRSLFVDLSDEEQAIVAQLGTQDGLPIDDLMGSLPQFTPSQLAALLLQLELKGVIECTPGKIYRICQ